MFCTVKDVSYIVFPNTTTAMHATYNSNKGCHARLSYLPTLTMVEAGPRKKCV